MSAKLGRPTDAPKTISAHIRFSKDDIKRLEYCSEKLQKTKTDVIRQGIQIIYESLQEK